MSDENLTQLLAKRAPRPRSKVTTALVLILVLLVGVFIGGAIGKGAANAPSGAPTGTSGPTSAPDGPPPAGGAAVRGSVSEAGVGTITIDTRDSSGLTPGDEVVILKAPEGAPAPVSP